MQRNTGKLCETANTEMTMIIIIDNNGGFFMLKSLWNMKRGALSLQFV